MINGFPTQFLNPALPPIPQIVTTPEKGISTNPIIIQSPSLGMFGETQPLGEFTKKSKLTTDQFYVDKYPKYTNSKFLLDDGNIKITHKTTWTTEKEGPPFNTNNILLIETGNNPDTINVSKLPHNEIQLEINSRHYRLKLDKNEVFSQGLHIKSKGGDDKIRIDPNIDVAVTVEGGRGRDKIEALGSGNAHIYGGAGDDDITLGSGVGYAEGNNGNDYIKGGTGKTVMYGNNGNDRMFSGLGGKGTFSYMDGGNGKDIMVSESPFNLVHGGPGEDLMIGKAPTTFYTGRDRDTVISTAASDKIYADAGDRISRIPGTTLKQVTISNAGTKGFNIEGSAEFKQRTQDDLEFLRNSPTAQKILTELDNAAERNGSPINIKETVDGGPSYSFVNDFTKKTDSELKDYDDLEGTPPLGFIKNNLRGSVATDANIHHNPKIHFNDHDAPPIVSLYHEMAHAYNGANGTLLGGTTQVSEDAFPEPNLERQAIGLETDAPAFDFDNNPATPPTKTNPKVFTENALREETGFPLREKVYVIPSE